MQRPTCERVRRVAAMSWYVCRPAGRAFEAHCHDGFATLAVVVPCCGTASSLDALDYDWPCGFARFEIAIRNPERAWFSDEELTAIGDALGHPVQQIRAHI